MVFSSIPAYLDPSNWQQQQNHGQIIGSSSANPLLPPPPHPPPPPPPPHGGSPGSIRPGSMAERARLANIPMPEAALKCPRCESTNTKFCYFNNYSLSQPRHFCKTCRRYWTRGGALRNVPVGGGCRRNKRSKSSSRSKSPGTSSDRQTNNNNNNNNGNNNINSNNNNNNNASSTSSIPTNIGSAANILGLAPQLPPLRFMSPNLAQLTDNFAADHIGLSSYGMGTTTNDMNFHGNLLSGGSILSSDGANIEPWRLQQFPFFGGGLDQSPNINYQFHGGESNFMAGGGTSHHHHHHHQAVRPKFSSLMMSQAAPVKMEDNHPELNLSRQLLLGNMAGNNEQWNNSNTVNWTELSSFSSSSTSNPL